MNTALSEAIKEAFALAPSNVVYLETLEIIHPQIVDSIRLVKDRANHDFRLESGVVKTFEAAGFRMALPQSGDNGLQELTIGIDNVDRRVSDFLNTAATYGEMVTVIFRPYLSTDPNTVQMNPPLELYLTDIAVTALEVTGKATFANINNKPFPTERYTRSRFPSLGNS